MICTPSRCSRYPALAILPRRLTWMLPSLNNIPGGSGMRVAIIVSSFSLCAPAQFCVERLSSSARLMLRVRSGGKPRAQLVGRRVTFS
jgi:hypothetical protein